MTWEAGAQAMREAAAKVCERHADEREAFIKAQGGFYVQYEDQGHTMTKVRTARACADFIRALPLPPAPAGDADDHAVWHRENSGAARGEGHNWTCAICGVKVNRAELHLSHGIDSPALDLCPPCFRKRKAAHAAPPAPAGDPRQAQSSGSPPEGSASRVAPSGGGFGAAPAGDGERAGDSPTWGGPESAKELEARGFVRVNNPKRPPPPAEAERAVAPTWGRLGERFRQQRIAGRAVVEALRWVEQSARALVTAEDAMADCPGCNMGDGELCQPHAAGQSEIMQSLRLSLSHVDRRRAAQPGAGAAPREGETHDVL